MRVESNRRQLIFAAILLLAFAGVSMLLLANPSQVELRARVDEHPRVRVLEVVLRDIALSVYSQGTIVPRVQSEFVPEVSGRVAWVSPALADGGAFDIGEALLRIDSIDHEAALRRARANVIHEEAEHTYARQELERRKSLAGSAVVSKEKLADAKRAERVTFANLENAQVDLEEAERNLDRTELRAPFAGRVREKRVDVGEFVERGHSVGTLYAIDHAEVRLPVPDRDLVFLDWPSTSGMLAPDTGPAVTLRAELGGIERAWQGRVVRTDGSIDPRTRMVHVIARVEAPYGQLGESTPAPLAVGLFVKAEIDGRVELGAVALPRLALRGRNRVLVVGPENHLREREVGVLRVEGDRVIVTSGLEDGERVCITDVPLFVEGMKVVVSEAPGVESEP